MEPKARKAIKGREDLLDCPELLVFLEWRDPRVWTELKDVPDRWGWTGGRWVH